MTCKCLKNVPQTKESLFRHYFDVWGLLTGEEMMVVLSQFESALVQLPGALPRLGTEPGPHVLDTLLAVWIQEHHDGVPLSVVQTIHRIGGDVQHGMLVLAAQTES